ncbi:N-acetylneuraminate synthase [Peribacillus asahii]|uniref:N-acetylneuraminate synthase n=1 Tax=Peribacillus asahii TaxID=228899 RepID=UPI003804A16A
MTINKKVVYIIAEIGVNHNGDIELAKKSILAAKECGANAVKFQTFKTEKLVTKNAEKAKYQIENTKKDGMQYDMLKKLELSQRETIILKEFCHKHEIDFISSPFDEESAMFLKDINVDVIKIGSGEITNLPLLKKINQLGLPVILSTGMSNMGDVEEAVNELKDVELSLLHCTSCYPAPFEDVNLYAMVNLKNVFGLSTGYSDHTLGSEVSVGAVALGAELIEKHFTLDNDLAGPDHKASLNPQNFKKFVQSIRNIEKSLGDGIKRCMPSELSTQKVSRKSIVLAKSVEKGQTLNCNDLLIKRPGYGIPPKFIDLIVGRVISKDMKIDDILTWDDLL